MLAVMRLARWLGPWADATKAPPSASRDEHVDDMRVRIYEPRGRRRRTFLIAPGLHYAGADDPRMDRFCRILAAAGHLVIAPFVPDFLALRPSERAKQDFARAFAALPRWSEDKPVVFSISFGSLLAFALAAAHGDRIERLVIFGGYSSLRETLRYCLTGQGRDPLNQPVVVMNLLHLMECADREALAAAWRRYVERTWGRPELKARDKYVAIGEALAAEVPPAIRELFRIGVGVVPGASELALEALTRFDTRALDPTPYLSRITNRVDLVHGVDDDVIPFDHSHALAAALSNADVRVHITGMYGHTGSARPPLRTAAKELLTMLRVLRVLS